MCQRVGTELSRKLSFCSQDWCPFSVHIAEDCAEAMDKREFLEKAINLFSYSQLAGSLAVAIVCLQTEDRIPVLGPGSSSTVDCPPVLGGLGRWSGEVLDAELEIVVSYDQSWWPFGIITERNAFTAKRDSQRAVHWVHITPAEEKPLFPLSTPSSSRPAEWESFLWINVRSSCP